MATQDLARIVSLIMENPKLIEEISNMAAADSKKTDTEKSEGNSTRIEPEERPASEEESAATSAPPRLHENNVGGKHRSELLCALKPYVSQERAHAIDSMLSIVEILDLMKRR